ncbi:hypothetical protein D3C87_640460 [compost metagenome]
MRHFALMATAATIALTALPASAQMRNSAPKPAAAASTMTDAGVRPSNIAGAERAQVLPKGSLIWNMGSLGFQYGLMDNLELDVNAGWNPGLNLAPAFALTGGLNAGVGAKYILMNSSAMSVAVDGGINLGFAGGTLTTGFNAGVPISFWMGKSAFHVVPGILGTAAGSSIGANLGYEQELNNKWRLFVGDRLAVTNAGALTNALNGGVRVAFTPNLTVDVGVAQANLDFNPTNIGAQATLLNFGATFGTKSIDELRGLFGI